MKRVYFSALLLLIGGLFLALPSHPISGNEEKDAPQNLDPFLIANLLEQPIAFDRLNQTAFKTVMEVMSDHLKIPLMVREKNDPAIVNELMEKSVSLSLPKNTTGRYALKNLLDQVGYAYLIRKNHIELVELNEYIEELNQNVPESEKIPGVQFDALVTMKIDNQPLKAAMKRIGDQYEISFAFSPIVEEEAKTVISSQFVNVPKDTVVKMLAELGDLGVIKKRNVFLFTTQERAEQFREQEHKNELRLNGGLGQTCLGIGFGFQGAAAQIPVDLSKLQSIETKLDEIKKRLEDVEKPMKK